MCTPGTTHEIIFFDLVYLLGGEFFLLFKISSELKHEHISKVL